MSITSRSKFPTVAASEGKKLKGFQSWVNLLLFNKKFLNELNKNSADLDFKNDSPNIINGFWELTMSFESAFLFSKISLIVWVFPSRLW